MTTQMPTASVAPVEERRAELPAGRYGLRQLLLSEWTKLRTVRSTVWTLATTVVLIIGIGALATGLTARNGSPDPSFDPTSRSLSGLFLGAIAIGVLGVLTMTSEYASGTIRATLGAAPRRWLVLACKALVFAGVVVVASEIMTLAAFFLGQQLLSGRTATATLSQPGVARSVVGTGLTLTVAGLFAMAIAVIIRHTAGAIAAYVGVLLVLPLIIGAFPFSFQEDVNKFLPLLIAERMARPRFSPLVFGGTLTFSPWAGFAVFCGYTVALFLIGGYLLSRRDA